MKKMSHQQEHYSVSFRKNYTILPVFCFFIYAILKKAADVSASWQHCFCGRTAGGSRPRPTKPCREVSPAMLHLLQLVKQTRPQ
jgi:hypothetical protein